MIYALENIGENAMMMFAWKKTITALLLCLFWFGAASMSNVVGKIVLNNFPYPMTLTFAQLFSSSVYSVPLLYFWKLKANSIPKSYFLRWVLPLAVGKCLAAGLSHLAIWKVPVSYAHTVKATMPIFTVVLTRVLFGDRQKIQVHLSLIPIVAGVAIATVTELAFDVIGLVAALAATVGFSLQNIFSKKLMKETGVHSFVVVSVLARVSMLMVFPFWLGFDVWRLVEIQSSVAGLEVDWWNLIMLLAINGMLNFSKNLLGFAFLSMVTPLTYAAASASQRLAIIGLSLLLLRNDVTVANVAGISLALAGVLLYTLAKHSNHSKSMISVIDDGIICVASTSPAAVTTADLSTGSGATSAVTLNSAPIATDSEETNKFGTNGAPTTLPEEPVVVISAVTTAAAANPTTSGGANNPDS